MSWLESGSDTHTHTLVNLEEVVSEEGTMTAVNPPEDYEYLLHLRFLGLQWLAGQTDK